MATAQPGTSVKDLLYVRRRYLSVEQLRRAIGVVADGTLAARDPALWGTERAPCRDVVRALRKSDSAERRGVGTQRGHTPRRRSHSWITAARAERAGRAVALAGAEHALASQAAAAGEGSLRDLGGARWRALAAAARGARTPAEERALAALAVLSRKLREAHDEITGLSMAWPATTASSSGTAAGPPDPVWWEDIEADLRD